MGLGPAWSLEELDAAIAGNNLGLTAEEISVFVADRLGLPPRSAQKVRSKLSYQGVYLREPYPSVLDRRIMASVIRLAKELGMTPKSVAGKIGYINTHKKHFENTLQSDVAIPIVTPEEAFDAGWDLALDNIGNDDIPTTHFRDGWLDERLKE